MESHNEARMDAEPSPLPPKRRPTIYDIAQKLDLSPSTVSRALSKPGRINAKTEAKIRATAQELGYRLNPMARALPTGMTGTYALIVPDITNPVHFELIRGAESVTKARGFALVISETQGIAEAELNTIATLQLSVDGALLVASRLPDDQLIELATVTPIVAANHTSAGLPSVFPDALAGLTAAMDHLRALGHSAIAYLGGLDVQINRSKWEILLSLAVDRGMSIVEIPISGPTLAGGAEALARVLASKATAVIAYNDLVAHGVLRAARSASIDVPGQFSVVGFDDIFSAELSVPALTTIRTPLFEIGATAMSILVDTKANREPTRVTLPTEFIVRESTAIPTS